MLLRFYKGGEAPLISAFMKMNRDRLWDIVFPSIGPMTLREFKRYFHDKWIIASVDRKTDIQTMAWIWDICGPVKERKASFGFLSFRELWGTRMLRSAAILSVDEFLRLFEIKILFALIREDNRLAVRFAKRIGFRELVSIPNYILHKNKLIDGVLMCRMFRRRR